MRTPTAMPQTSESKTYLNIAHARDEETIAWLNSYFGTPIDKQTREELIFALQILARELKYVREDRDRLRDLLAENSEYD